MALVKVKQNYQITLPNSVRKNFNIAIGDYMEVDKQNGDIVLKPVKVVHPEQSYFFSKDWQKGEANADKDIDKGDVLGPFEDLEESLKALKTAKI